MGNSYPSLRLAVSRVVGESLGRMTLTIMVPIVPPKVSSHLAVVEYMQEALSLTTQGAGSVVLLLPQLQVGIMWKVVMCNIKGKLDGVGW